MGSDDLDLVREVFRVLSPEFTEKNHVSRWLIFLPLLGFFSVDSTHLL
jgi:hypothetical protein